DFKHDPTLQRSDRRACERCHNREAVFFQADKAREAASLSLVFVCTHCGHEWLG
ncbi:hypothetical protein JKP88DRAFT_160023, partial [Tribonema minus]